MREPFLSGGDPAADYRMDDRIPLAGEFAGVDVPQILYSSEEEYRKQMEQAHDHFMELAEIAVLEHHPGFKMILEMIDGMIQEETVMIDTSLDQVMNGHANAAGANQTLQAHTWASRRFRQLKAKILDQVTEYHDAQKLRSQR
jgi:hypothetical protein